MSEKEPLKFFIKIAKIPMLLVFVAMLLLFGLPVFGQQAEVNRYAIVTAIGIDQGQEEDFEVSLLVFTPLPQQNFSEKYTVITTSGNDIAQCFDLAGLKLGREVGLSHIKFVVINETLLNENVSDLLDYLIRNVNLSASTKLIATDAATSDFIKATQRLDSESSIRVSEVVSYNNEYVYAVDSSMETFFKGTYGPTEVGLMSQISIKQASKQGQGSQDNSQQGSPDQQSSGDSPSEIDNQGTVIAFKGGKKIIKLTGDEYKNINFMKGEYNTGTITLENFTDDKDFKDASLTFEIFSKNQDFKVTYQNNVPVLLIDTKLNLRLSEIKNNADAPQENVELFAVSQKVEEEIEVELKKMLANGIMVMRDNQLDIVDFYTFLYNNNKSKFLDFLQTLEDKNDYLNHIVFKLGVRVDTQ